MVSSPDAAGAARELSPILSSGSGVGVSSGGDVKSPEELFTLLSVSCGSVTECVASDDNGDLLTTNDPAGGAAMWSAAHVDGTNMLDSVSCVASGLCVASDGVGNLLASTAPIGTRQSWAVTDNVEPSGVDAVVCQSATLCLAGAVDGTIAVSHNPSAAAPTWSHTPRLGSGATRHPALVALSCPAASSCVALDGAGNLLSTARPAGSAPSWSRRALNPGVGAAYSISCVAGGICVAIGPQSHVAVGAVRGNAAWELTNLNLFSIDDNGIESPDSLGSVSCASRTLCVATDYSDGVGDTGLGITSGSSTRSLTTIACASRSLCVAFDRRDRVLVSTDPRGGPSSWTPAGARLRLDGRHVPVLGAVPGHVRRRHGPHRPPAVISPAPAPGRDPRRAAVTGRHRPVQHRGQG